MDNSDNRYTESVQRNQDFNSAGNTVYYDGRKMKKPTTVGKVILVVWAVATLFALGYTIITNKGSNFVFALIWQAVFVASFYLFRYNQAVVAKLISIIGMFISFAGIGVSISTTQENATLDVSLLGVESILPITIFALFFSMFAIGYSKQQYDRKASRYCSVVVNATVSSVKRSYTTLGKSYIPVLSYSFNGKNYETVYNRPLDFSKNRYQTGQTAVIKIDPANPSNIYVAPQSFNQTSVEHQNDNINAIVDDFKNLYANPKQYYNENTSEYAGANEYGNQAVETNTTYHNRKPNEPVKFSPMGCIVVLWFAVSVLIGVLGAIINPFITLMAFGQIPLVLGVVVFFGIGKGTTHNPTLGGCMFFVGLVLVVISGINIFGNQTITQQFEEIAPILILSVFNIAGISLICVPLYYAYMNKKHHTQLVTGYVIGMNHRITHRKRVGLIDIYAPIYGYTYKGKKYITESIVYSEADYPTEGSSRNILINPDNPKEIYEPDRSDTNTLIFILFGSLFVLASLIATFLFIASSIV